MNARELFEKGRLSDAIEAQNAVVKANPSDLDARYALSVFLCFAGNLDRAFLQLNTMGKQDAELAMATNIYRNQLIAELQRRKVYNEDAKPLLPPDCPRYVEERLEAILALRRGDTGAANTHLDRAAETESGRPGKLNGQRFDAIRDSDDLLGSVLEVYAGDTYLWIPFAQIRKIEIHEPAHLLDLLFMPAEIEDVGGAEAQVYIPALYEGTHLSSDGLVQTGKMTDWLEIEGLGHRGVGQKLLMMADGDDTPEIALREVRSLEFDTVDSGESTSG